MDVWSGSGVTHLYPAHERNVVQVLLAREERHEEDGDEEDWK